MVAGIFTPQWIYGPGYNVNTTEELRIDASGPSFEACQTDAPAFYAAAGFTPAKTVAAFQTIATETAAAFQDQLLSVAILHRAAFPPIDNNGVVSTTITVPDALTATILASTTSTYGSVALTCWYAVHLAAIPSSCDREDIE